MTSTEISQFDSVTNQNVNIWLNGSYDIKTKQEILNLLKNNPQEIVDSFYTNLSFGTGGIRGIMGVGTNRLNEYTIKLSTQGLANYINKQIKTADVHSVLIGYDSRHNSKEFAEVAAKVLAGNGIKVYIYQDIRPTPIVSFGCRYKKTTSAIMITASHNPPQYNGYKVYWNDGAQVLPPHDQGIVDEVNKIKDIDDVKSINSLESSYIEWIEDEVDIAYLSAINELQLYPDENKEKGNLLKVVYTSLHGTGITMVPGAMKKWGFTNVELVSNQVIPDGDFPTCPSPNPEEKDALKLGIEKLLKDDADLLIATDPDCDRVGAAVKHDGRVVLIDGNQMACLLLHHIIDSLHSLGTLPANAAFVKTIVTSELFKEICNNYQKTCFDVLTGFKYIGEKIRNWDTSKEYQYIFGGEESYGYLYGKVARDKDAIICSVLMSEMALQAKLKGKTLVDVLQEIWKKYGTYVEKLISVKFEDTKAGKEQMAHGMKKLQENPPKFIEGIEVSYIEDYEKSIAIDFKDGTSRQIMLPKSEVLLFRLSDGTKLVVRPSGTEPKIKIYCGVVKKDTQNIAQAVLAGEEHAQKLLEALKTYLIEA